MANPAEKIRQVVQEGVKRIDDLEGKPYDHFTEEVLEDAIAFALDAIIEEIEEDLYTPSYVNSAYDTGAHNAKFRIIEILKEARTSLEK